MRCSAKLGEATRFPVERIDAGNQSMVADLARKHKVDLVMNSVDPIFNEPVFDAAFEVGAMYMDMAMTLSEPHPTDPFSKAGVKLGDYQFERAEAWDKKGLLALVGLGVEPGMADVFARHAQDHLVRRDRRDRHSRRRQSGGAGLRVRPEFLNLDDDRGMPQSASHLGKGSWLVHHRTILRAGDVRVPRGHWKSGSGQRGTRGGAARAALGKDEARDLQVWPRATSSSVS